MNCLQTIHYLYLILKTTTVNTKSNSINSIKNSNHIEDIDSFSNNNFVSKRLGLTLKAKFHQLGSSLLDLFLRPSRHHSASFYRDNTEKLLRLYALLHPTVGNNLPSLFSFNTNKRSNTLNKNIALTSLITPATITPPTSASITPNRRQQPYTYRDAIDELNNMKNQTLIEKIEHKISLDSFNLINKLTVDSSLATFCKINTINRKISLRLFDTPIGLSNGLSNKFYIGFSSGLSIGFYTVFSSGLSNGFYTAFFMELCSDLKNQTMNKTRLDLNSSLRQLSEQFSQSKDKKENNLLKQLDKLVKGQRSNKKQLQSQRSKPKSSKISLKNLKFVAAYRYPNPYYEIRLPEELVKKIRQSD